MILECKQKTTKNSLVKQIVTQTRPYLIPPITTFRAFFGFEKRLPIGRPQVSRPQSLIRPLIEITVLGEITAWSESYDTM